MATPKQSAANRTNAQKSSGPRTSAGKAISRFNALKHGIYAVHQIMFDEKPEDLAELTAEYHEHHRPADPKERILVDILVQSEWRLRRMRRIEADLWYRAYDAFVVKNIEVTLTCTSGEAFATDSGAFERLQRLVNSCERDYHRALKELVARGHALRRFTPPEPGPAAAPADPANVGQALSPAQSAAPPQPQQSKSSSANLGSFRQNPQTPPPAAPNAPANPLEPPRSAADRHAKPSQAAPP
jgi:hypothetical protein